MIYETKLFHYYRFCAIYNALGQIIDNGIISNTEYKVRNTKLNSGVYVVNVNGKTQKIIIK